MKIRIRRRDGVTQRYRVVLKKGKYHRTLKGAAVISLAQKLKSKLNPYAKKIEIAGSIRRKIKDPVDIDLVIIPKDKDKIREQLGKIGRITAGGEKMIETKIDDVYVDTYFATEKDFGAQLMTRTGPWQGNLGNRTLAKNKGMLLNQYGLFNKKTGKRIAGRTEKKIYEALGKKYKEPELRGR